MKPSFAYSSCEHTFSTANATKSHFTKSIDTAFVEIYHLLQNSKKQQIRTVLIIWKFVIYYVIIAHSMYNILYL